MIPFYQHFRKIATVFSQTPRVVRLVWQADPHTTAVLPILTLLAAPLPVLYLYCWKKVIDGVGLCLEEGMRSGQNIIIFFLIASLVISVLLRGLDCLLRFLERRLNLQLRQHVQKLILEKATALDMAFYETPAFYDKLQRAQQESSVRPYAVLSSLVIGLRQCVTLCSYLAALFLLSWWVVPCLLLVTIPGLFLQAKYGQLGWIIVHRRTPEERRMHYYQHLMTSNYEAKEVRLFRLADYLIPKWLELFRQFYKQDISLSARKNLAEFGALTLQTIAVTGFYVFAIYRTVVDPLVSIGSLFMYTQAMERATGTITTVFHVISSLYENNLYLSNLFEYLTQEPQVCSPEISVPVPTKIRRGVLFESVSFRYPNSTKDVLKNISFEIKPGERIAIVGENGSGKTTLIKLLARLYDPQKGRITVDDIDLRKFNPTEWQKQIGIIFQDFIRYWVSARENIGFGQFEDLNDMSRILCAAESSGVAECIERLDGKWEAVLGKLFEEGQELSMGEWQGIALARAFFRNSSILVLDEPTASLDAKHEFEIFARFNELTRDQTAVLISHRFSTVRMVDRILVMEDGQVIESGEHDELMTLDKKYSELFNRQASAYR
jgi:ATP-binding cassette subfamily B protein